MRYWDWLDMNKACSTALNWSYRYATCLDAVRDCNEVSWLTWLLGHCNLEIRNKIAYHRKFRMAACRFIRELVGEDGRVIWDLLEDERSRNAVIVAERYSKDEATQEELEEVYKKALEAVDIYGYDRVYNKWAAQAAAEVAWIGACYTAFNETSRITYLLVAWNSLSENRGFLSDEKKKERCDIIRDVFADEFKHLDEMIRNKPEISIMTQGI